MKRISGKKINFDGDLIINQKEEILAYVHKSGNIEFPCEETEEEDFECIIKTEVLKQIVAFL